MTGHANCLHSYIKGRVFVSQVIHLIAEALGKDLKSGTTKRAHTIAVPERAQATTEISLKMASGEYRKQRHNFFKIPTLKQKTTYHYSIDCDPSRIFHGKIAQNTLDHKLGRRFNPNIAPTTDFADEIFCRNIILSDKPRKMSCSLTANTESITTKKTDASLLKAKDYCFVLQPKADHHESKLFCDFI